MPTPRMLTPKPKRSYKWLWLAIIALVVLAVVWYTIFESSVFRIANVSVEGTSDAAVVSVANQLVGTNIFRINLTSLESRVKRAYPSIDSVDIVRGIPKSVRVIVTMRQAALRWQSNGKIYIVDASGQVFGEIDASQNTNLPLVIDPSNVSVAIGKQVAYEPFVEFMTQLHNSATSMFHRNIVSTQIDETIFMVDLELEGNLLIKLTSQRPLDEQLKAALSIYNAHPNATMIDVRVPGWGYWK